MFYIVEHCSRNVVREGSLCQALNDNGILIHNRLYISLYDWKIQKTNTAITDERQDIDDTIALPYDTKLETMF